MNLKKFLRPVAYREEQIELMTQVLYEKTLLDIAEQAHEILSTASDDTQEKLDALLAQLEELQNKVSDAKMKNKINAWKKELVAEYITEKVG